MSNTATRRMALEQDRRISGVVNRERSRLLNFIRRREQREVFVAHELEGRSFKNMAARLRDIYNEFMKG